MKTTETINNAPREAGEKHTAGPWVVDNGVIVISDQAEMLIENAGTEREWTAIGTNDEDGFAQVVALAHPINARLIAAAPDLLAALMHLSAELRRSRFKMDVRKDYSLMLAAAQADKLAHSLRA